MRSARNGAVLRAPGPSRRPPHQVRRRRLVVLNPPGEIHAGQGHETAAVARWCPLPGPMPRRRRHQVLRQPARRVGHPPPRNCCPSRAHDRPHPPRGGPHQLSDIPVRDDTSRRHALDGAQHPFDRQVHSIIPAPPQSASHPTDGDTTGRSDPDGRSALGPNSSGKEVEGLLS